MKISAALVSLCLAAACGGEGEHSATGAGREPDEYVGCAADEHWPSFDDASDDVSDSDAPQLTAPSSTAAVALVPVPDFTWRASAGIAGTTAGDIPMDCAQWNTGFSTLHLPPVSGTVYDLQVSIAGKLEHRVITSLQRWTPQASLWASWAGKSLSIRLRRMTLLENDRKEGPYAPTAPVTLTVSTS